MNRFSSGGRRATTLLAAGSVALALAVFSTVSQGQTLRPLSQEDAAAKEEYAYSARLNICCYLPTP